MVLMTCPLRSKQLLVPPNQAGRYTRLLLRASTVYARDTGSSTTLRCQLTSDEHYKPVSESFLSALVQKVQSRQGRVMFGHYRSMNVRAMSKPCEVGMFSGAHEPNEALNPTRKRYYAYGRFMRHPRRLVRAPYTARAVLHGHLRERYTSRSRPT